MMQPHLVCQARMAAVRWVRLRIVTAAAGRKLSFWCAASAPKKARMCAASAWNRGEDYVTVTTDASRMRSLLRAPAPSGRLMDVLLVLSMLLIQLRILATLHLESWACCTMNLADGSRVTADQLPG